MSIVEINSADTETLRYLWTPDLDPLFWREGRAGVLSEWYGHIPFAHWIVDVLRPRTVVELGTHHGVSYSAFCEAVVRNGLNSRCYAVDAWKGDDQAGHYGEEVYWDLRQFNDAHYNAFSELLRCTFDDALAYISDASVDLLHIDGFHTCEAVRHDFENWRPKLSDSAVVLFHDTNVRERDFGVWHFWEELRLQFPSFEFLHGHGLGVLAVGSSIPPQVAALCSLADPARVSAIRQRFSLLGERWIVLNQVEQLKQQQAAGAAAREARIQSLEAEAAAREARIQSLEAEAAAREARVQSLEAEVAARDARIQSSEAEAARRLAVETRLRAQAAQRAKQARTEAANAIAAVQSAASKALELEQVDSVTEVAPAIEIIPEVPVFDTQPIEHSSGPTRFSRDTGRSLICVTHVMPYPPQAGNEYRIHRMLTWLAGRNWDILLVVCPPSNKAVTERQLTEAARLYPNLIVCQRDGRLVHQLVDGGAMLEALRGRRPRAFATLLGETERGNARKPQLLALMRECCPDALAELVLHLEVEFDPQVLLAESVFMTRPFAMLRPGLFKIIDTIDLSSATSGKVVRYGIEEALTLDPGIASELLNRADLLIAIQAADADALRILTPHREVISVGVDFTLLNDAPPSATRPVILLVASANPRNIKGLKDFLRFAWPLIRRAVPKAELRVIGSVGEAVEPPLPGVQILGCVEDLNAAYAEARVIINPAVAGNGLDIRTVEALRHLRPIVVWPSGIDGLGPEMSALCHVASNWFDFARHAIRLAGEEDGARVLIDRCATLAQQFAPDIVYAPLGAVLDNRQMATRQRSHVQRIHPLWPTYR
jgi:hypothetical protein